MSNSKYATMVLEMNEQECLELINTLEPMRDGLREEVFELIDEHSFKINEVLEYIVISDPILWAKVYLNWTCRDYQIPILKESAKSKAIVLRLGRRLGKTDTMCIIILWMAFTQLNKGENGQYNILILTPYVTQVDLIFDRLGQLIEGSPFMKSLISRDIEHRYELDNGTIVTGLTVGASSGKSGGNNTRGQRSDLIILDECDYMGSSQITNVLNIRNEAPERIKIIAASTPSGKREEYFHWCTGSTKSYHVKQSDIDNYQFTGYEIKEAEKLKGNGWVEIWAPSVVNKELLKINNDTGRTYLEDLKDSLTETRYEQEVLALFGDEEMGVYKKHFIEYAINEGIRVNHSYIDYTDREAVNNFLRKRARSRGPLILGCDWDKIA